MIVATKRKKKEREKKRERERVKATHSTAGAPNNIASTWKTTHATRTPLTHLTTVFGFTLNTPPLVTGEIMDETTCAKTRIEVRTFTPANGCVMISKGNFNLKDITIRPQNNVHQRTQTALVIFVVNFEESFPCMKAAMMARECTLEHPCIHLPEHTETHQRRMHTPLTINLLDFLSRLDQQRTT